MMFKVNRIRHRISHKKRNSTEQNIDWKLQLMHKIAKSTDFTKKGIFFSLVEANF